VLHAIAFELGLGVDRHADRLEVMHALQDYLVSQHAQGQRVVLFIEESQSMPVPTLEEIRLLSNLETRNDKLLQMVLFGQPELDEILRRPDIRQLRDRIAHSFRLDPLSDADVREYLMFRMRAAGYRGPEIFSRAVVRQIARASSGLTRRINLIADKALLAAFAENTHTIDKRHVQAALRDSEFGQAPLKSQSRPRYAWAALVLLAGAALGAGLYAVIDTGLLRHSAAPQVATGSAPATGSVALPAAAGSAVSMATPAAQPARPPAAGEAMAAAVTPPPPSPATPVVAAAAPAPAQAPVPVPAPAAAATPLPAAAAAAPEAPGVERTASTPPPASASDAPSVSGVGDVIANRMEATRRWLKSDEPKPYSIQLLTADSEQQLRNNLKALSKFIEVNDIYMYRSVAQGKPAVSVLWGTFNSRQAAAGELEELPRPLRAARPYVRSIESVRAEVDRNSVSR
jgi:septal ring-binding cell division protein DamX